MSNTNSQDDGGRQSVLVLYNDRSGATQYVREHVGSFGRHSRHAIVYAPANVDNNLPWDAFDAVIIHFSVKLAYKGAFAPSILEGTKTFQGAKLLLIQDEYDRPGLACEMICKLGIAGVFTTTPAEYRHRFYPAELTGALEFHRCLTGYVPAALIDLPRRPIAERRIPIGYRGRILPFWLGRLAREKYEIGQRVAQICRDRSIAHDIAWTDQDRIYGNNWYNFLGDCKSMLGTESGANIIDWDGSLQSALQAALAENPALTFEQAHAQFLAMHENAVCMNQVAPKVFEAIALGTPLILYAGHHSGVVEPGRHYIPLQKDLSNIDEVLATVADDDALQELADRAYADIVGSGRYSYLNFVSQVDEAVDRLSEVAARGGDAVRPSHGRPQRSNVGAQLQQSRARSGPLHRLLPSLEPYWNDPWADLENEYRKADRLIDENRALRRQLGGLRRFSPSRIIAKLGRMVQSR